jgi:DNA replication licensing factor MCM7
VQALARLRFSRAVQQSDVDEALRLMQMSKMSLQDDETRRSGLDPISDVYTIIRDEAKKKDTIQIQYTDALNWITRKVRHAKRRKAARLTASLTDPVT